MSVSEPEPISPTQSKDEAIPERDEAVSEPLIREPDQAEDAVSHKVDHFSKLPAEMKVEIFSYLDIKIRIKAKRVARTWSVDMTAPKIWQSFILEGISFTDKSEQQRSSTEDSLRRLIKKQVKLIDLNISHDVMSSLLNTAARRAQSHLKTLRISFAPYARSEFNGSLRTFLRDLCCLEDLELHDKAVDWLLYRDARSHWTGRLARRLGRRPVVEVDNELLLPPKLKRLKLLNIYSRSSPVAWNLQGSIEELECSGGHIWTTDLKPFAQTLRVLKVSDSTIDWSASKPNPRTVRLARFTKLQELSILRTRIQAKGPLPDSLQKLSLASCRVMRDFTGGIEWLSDGDLMTIFGPCAVNLFPVLTSSDLQVWDMVNVVRVE